MNKLTQAQKEKNFRNIVMMMSLDEMKAYEKQLHITAAPEAYAGMMDILLDEMKYQSRNM